MPLKEDEMNLLEQTIKTLQKENKELKEALNWFCNRVDAGEVRSKRTYERFKELLDKYE